MRLKDKVAIVTGAASGFGAGIAARFAAEGAKVALLDLNLEGAEQGAEAAGPGAIAVKCDVTSADEIDAAVAATLKAVRPARHRRQQRRLDASQQAAARGERGRVRPRLQCQREVDLSDDAGDDAGAARRRRRLRHQHRLDGGPRPRPGLTWYNGSKGFVNLVSKSMAVELAPHEDPRQLHRPGARPDGPHRGVHRRPGDAGAARRVHGDDPARAHVEGVRRRRRGGLSRQRRGGVHHRRRAARRRRPHDLT